MQQFLLCLVRLTCVVHPVCRADSAKLLAFLAEDMSIVFAITSNLRAPMDSSNGKSRLIIDNSIDIRLNSNIGLAYWPPFTSSATAAKSFFRASSCFSL